MDNNLYKPIEERMDRRINNLNNDYGDLRAGRANPKLLNKVVVNYYGTPTPVNQMAAVSVAEARILVIQPFDPSTIKDIEKAINASDMGIPPQNDGKVIRLTFPQLTEERRKELVKTVHKYAEECKVSIRQVRRESIDKFKKMEKAKELTEDDLKDAEKKIQDITDKYCKEVEKLEQNKEKEILSI